MDDPSHQTLASHELARSLLAQNRPAEALPHCEAAVRLSPNHAAGHDNLGTALRLLGRLDEARAAYLEATLLDPNLATAHANLGLVYLDDDRTDDALACLERALELDPHRAIYWEYLARLHEWMGRYDLAIPCWEQALGLTPAPPAKLHLSLGRALHEEGRLAEAEAQFLKALAIEPENGAVLVNLGRIQLERGDFTQAETTIRRALAIDPNDDWARAWLATLLVGDLPTDDLNAMLNRLDALGADNEHRVRLSFASGLVLDAQADYPRAARHFREANSLSIAQARGRKRYVPAQYAEFIQEQIDTFNPAFFRRTADAGLNTRLPVFILGLPRSGTTLIEQILASHPQIHGAGELSLAQRMIESLPAILDFPGSPAQCASLLEPAAIGLIARAYLSQLESVTDRPVDRIIDKQPGNYNYLGFLTALFPHATIIHCRRDLRDVALSCWMSDFSIIKWANDPSDIAAHFRGYLRIMDHWKSCLRTPIHEVHYEETVSDLEGVARRLLAALGLDWNPACLEFHRSRRPVRTASRKQVREPVYNRSVGRWKRYENEFPELFEAIPLEPSPL